LAFARFSEKHKPDEKVARNLYHMMDQISRLMIGDSPTRSADAEKTAGNGPLPESSLKRKPATRLLTAVGTFISRAFKGAELVPCLDFKDELNCRTAR
jgi:hypothetical protein